MFDSIDRTTFQHHGLIRCENFLPVAKVERAQDAMFEHLATMGIRSNGEWQAPCLLPEPMPDFVKAVRNGIKRHPALLELLTGEVPQVVGALLGGVTAYPMDGYPAVLFTLPDAQTWTLPHAAWHLDAPRLAKSGIPGVQIFTFLERVVFGGGGTLVVAGSHHLLNDKGRLSSQAVRKHLKRMPYFQKLMTKGTVESTVDRQHFLDEPTMVDDVAVDDVAVQVVELHGEPGDVYFMDLRLLHTVSPNVTATPRIMLTQRYLLGAAYEAIYRSAVPAGI